MDPLLAGNGSGQRGPAERPRHAPPDCGAFHGGVAWQNGLGLEFQSIELESQVKLKELRYQTTILRTLWPNEPRLLRTIALIHSKPAGTYLHLHCRSLDCCLRSRPSRVLPRCIDPRPTIKTNTCPPRGQATVCSGAARFPPSHPRSSSQPPCLPTGHQNRHRPQGPRPKSSPSEPIPPQRRRKRMEQHLS